MAAHIGQPTRSRRFIKLYLSTWGLLAAGALAYLAVLAFPPQAAAPPVQAAAQPVTTGASESKALAEVRSMRGSLSEIRKDVSQLQEAVGERVANEKVAQTRLTALEERVSTIDSSQPPTAEPDAKVSDKAARKTSELQPWPDAPGRTQEEAASAVAAPPFVPIETGSITPKEEIVFGEPVVTRAGRPEFAVQLAAAASVQALRQSWGQLTERHAGALGSLQPRVIAPRSEGGVYRLIAGPVATKADAERICSALRVGPKACFATPYDGAPL